MPILKSFTVSFGATIPVAEFSNITPKVELVYENSKTFTIADVQTGLDTAKSYIFEIAAAVAQRQINEQVEINSRTLFTIEDDGLLKLRLRHSCPAFNWLCLNRKVDVQAIPKTDSSPAFIAFNYGE